jgi:transcriptional regulator with XRE-family HTH domain
MEFKDNLKQLRAKKNLTQAQLAEKLFVSRSTIAKWENGIGLPNPDSMTALEEFFGITAQEIATKEPETIIVEKNRKLRLMGQIIGWTATLVLLIVIGILSFAIQNGKYGFTMDMAAGVFADNEYIDTGDCRFYYFTFDGELEDGRHWNNLQGWKMVKKHFWGYTVDYDSVQANVVTKDDCVVGLLYSIKGKNGYYHWLRKTWDCFVDTPGEPAIWDIPDELKCATSITIIDEEYELKNGFFFITQEPVSGFEIGDEYYVVWDDLI